MNKIFIIIQREFLKRVQKKSFIILTIATPVLLAALVLVPLWLASIEDDEQQKVAVVDPTPDGVYAHALSGSHAFSFMQVPMVDSLMRTEESPFDAVVVIQGDLVRNHGRATIYSQKEVPGNLLDYVQTHLDEVVQKQKLQATGIASLDKIIDDVQREVPVETVKWTSAGETTSSTEIAMVVGFLITMLIYVFVLSYGGMVMQSVVEEKANRIVELMVSSVKPFQLMMGKIIGVGLVGLLQMAIWGVLLSVILTVASVLTGTNALAGAPATPMAGAVVYGTTPAMSDTQEILTALANMPFLEIAVMFVLMFIGGYLLYASFFAATGASINEQEDTSQFVIPVTIIMVFALYAAIYSIENTDGPLAFWTSLFPLTSPIVMMTRLPFGVPLWQEALSVVLLYATAFLMVWLGGRIYRVGILMYGKKPSLKEIFKWMRYK